MCLYVRCVYCVSRCVRACVCQCVWVCVHVCSVCVYVCLKKFTVFDVSFSQVSRLNYFFVLVSALLWLVQWFV